MRDPTDFRRRDGNMASVITRSGRPGFVYYGGVFSPGANGTAYTSPHRDRRNGSAKVNASYQQYFDQYTTANIPLFNPRTGTMNTLFMGGISTYDYDYPDGPLTEVPPGGPGPAWVDDVSSLVQSKNGQMQEYIMPPLPGLYGAYSSVLPDPSVPAYGNGVINLAS